jgi:hypothetical protein
MIFSLSRGSDGFGEERFIAYLPFTLAPGAKINISEKEKSFEYSGQAITIHLSDHIYALTSGPYKSDDEGQKALEVLRSALLWLSLKKEIGVSYPKTTSQPKLHKHDEITEKNGLQEMCNSFGWGSVDGSYEAREAQVIPDHLKLIKFMGGQVSMALGIPAKNIIELLQETYFSERSVNVINNEKLRLAIEIYASYRFEVSDHAKLIRLVSSLEAITPSREVPEYSKKAIDQANQIIKSKRNEYKQGSREWKDIDRILSRLGNLKEESIGEGMRQFVREAISGNEDIGKQKEVLEKLKIAYDMRSKLLHEGHIDDKKLRGALEFLQDFVPKILTDQFSRTAENG